MAPSIPEIHHTINPETKKARRYNTKDNPVLFVQRWTIGWMDPTAVFIYAALVDQTNHDKGFAFPSVGDIGARAGVAKRQALRHLNTLAEDAFIVKEASISTCGRRNTNHYYVLEHPFDPTYKPRWTTQKKWKATDLVDFALRGHGLPAQWDSRVRETAHQLRREVVKVAADIDVSWAAMALAGALPDPSEYPDGSKRPKLYGHPNLTGEESDGIMVPELQEICEFQYSRGGL